MGFRDDLTATEGHLQEIGASVDAIVADVDRLHAKIMELENSPDRVTDADQARITAIVGMVGGLKDRVKALDDKTAAAPTAFLTTRG